MLSVSLRDGGKTTGQSDCKSLDWKELIVLVVNIDDHAYEFEWKWESYTIQ